MSVTNKVNETKNEVSKISDSIGQASDEIKKHAEEYTGELAKYIKGCPIKSVVVASLVGLLVGKILI